MGRREGGYPARHVMRAVEEEKKRLAHDMHDDCGPLLTSLQLGIETLKRSLPAGEPELVRQCDRLASLTAGLAGHLRNVICRLRPVLLEAGGIEPALRWYLREIGASCPHLALALHTVGCPGRLPADVEMTLFRLCQEGLHNVVRHARARRATICLHFNGESVCLRIEDDGDGFDPQQGSTSSSVPRGFGLPGMRQRVAALNGTLEVRSAPGQGVVIEASLPLARR